jgi:hypothetical protein
MLKPAIFLDSDRKRQRSIQSGLFIYVACMNEK